VAIFFSPNATLPIDPIDVIRILRARELQKRKHFVPHWQELEGEDCAFVTWWHLSEHDNNSQIFNGSLSYPDIEPTVLSLDDVTSAVSLAASVLVKPCPDVEGCSKKCKLYGLGLLFCRRKRDRLTSIQNKIAA
jgi:hypothetical protein